MTEPKNVLRARLYRRTTLESVSGLARRGNTIAFNLFVPSGFNSGIPRVSYKCITNEDRPETHSLTDIGTMRSAKAERQDVSPCLVVSYLTTAQLCAQVGSAYIGTSVTCKGCSQESLVYSNNTLC